MVKHFLTILIVVASLFFGSKMAASGITRASDILKEAKQNQMRFDKTYSGKVLFVSGYAGALIIGEKKEEIYLELMPTPDTHNPFDDIKCMFNGENDYRNPRLLGLNKGDAVVIRGKYNGVQKFQLHSLVLFDCAVLNLK